MGENGSHLLRCTCSRLQSAQKVRMRCIALLPECDDAIAAARRGCREAAGGTAAAKRESAEECVDSQQACHGET